jgi:hypothetical protein
MTIGADNLFTLTGDAFFDVLPGRRERIAPLHRKNRVVNDEAAGPACSQPYCPVDGRVGQSRKRGAGRSHIAGFGRDMGWRHSGSARYAVFWKYSHPRALGAPPRTLDSVTSQIRHGRFSPAVRSAIEAALPAAQPVDSLDSAFLSASPDPGWDFRAEAARFAILELPCCSATSAWRAIRSERLVH